jgi:hypothetical protein
MSRTKPICTGTPSIILLLVTLLMTTSGCEQQSPSDRVEEMQTTEPAPSGIVSGGVVRPHLPDCEDSFCANSLYAKWLRVEENVGIGVPSDSVENALEVNGTIVAEEVLVQPVVADYVFEPGYELRPLAHVEDFIALNRHLPGVPSVSDVEASGGKLGVAESYRILLEKVEELTLYTIEQDKRITELEKLLMAKGQ